MWLQVHQIEITPACRYDVLLLEGCFNQFSKIRQFCSVCLSCSSFPFQTPVSEHKKLYYRKRLIFQFLCWTFSVFPEYENSKVLRFCRHFAFFLWFIFLAMFPEHIIASVNFWGIFRTLEFFNGHFVFYSWPKQVSPFFPIFRTFALHIRYQATSLNKYDTELQI